MKTAVVLLIAVAGAMAQTKTGSIQGKVLDAVTLKPVSSALVIASRTGVPPFSRHTKSGADGAFEMQGLEPGSYSICVQGTGDRYLDPCQWGGNPTIVTLAAGQSVVGTLAKLTAASVFIIQVHDPLNSLAQTTKDGRRPDLALGVWGPKGVYYPAHGSGGPVVSLRGQPNSYRYQLAVPLDAPLNFHIASRDLKLGDAVGVSLPGNAKDQPFLHATGDANPQTFAVTVLGPLP